MKYKPFVYTQLLLIITTFELAAVGGEEPTRVPRVLQLNNPGSRPAETFLAMTNTTSENIHQSALPRDEESNEDAVDSATDFPSQISQCLAEHQHQITDSFVQGKHVILNCFKGAVMLTMLRRLGESSKSSIKLLDGLVELKKIPEKGSDGCGEGHGSCEGNYDRKLEADRKKKYVRMYKKAMEKLMNERKRFSAYRNQTQEEKAALIDRINKNSQAFLSEVIRTLRDENMERAEEENLKKDIADPKLLSVLDTISKNYMLKLRFYPGVAARMMRSHSGGFTFDLEIQDSAEEMEEDAASDDSSTREIKDGPQAKDYLDDDDDDGGNKKKRKADKKKKKQLKKKAKELKKIIPYLLLPMLIQMTLLPFVFKKLFFLAMKALFAGKMALILVGFNLLRNTCIQKDDDYQKIRVEHYGYRKGEEYGAWINGRRSLQGPSMVAALSEAPFRGQNPLRREASS